MWWMMNPLCTEQRQKTAELPQVQVMDVVVDRPRSDVMTGACDSEGAEDHGEPTCPVH